MYLINNTIPTKWSALHQDILFTFTYSNVNAIITGTSGKCNISWTDAEPNALKIGDIIYIFGASVSAYNGYHTITLINSNTNVVTNQSFSANATAKAKVLYVPVFEVWTGIDNSSVREKKKIATLTPRVNLASNSITVNVGEFLKADFTIKPPAIGTDETLINRYWIKEVVGVNALQTGNYLLVNDVPTFTEYFWVVNASEKRLYIEHELLSDMPVIIFSCHRTAYTSVRQRNILTAVHVSGIFDNGQTTLLTTEQSEPILTENGDNITI